MFGLKLFSCNNLHVNQQYSKFCHIIYSKWTSILSKRQFYYIIIWEPYIAALEGRLVN